MKDIVRYSEEEAKRLGVVLQKLGVRCPGPGTCHDLLAMNRSIEDIVDKNGHKLDQDQLELLLGVVCRVSDVIRLCISMQGKVLEEAQALVDKLAPDNKGQ